MLNRRTYSAHHTYDEAVKAAQNLCKLLNGIPSGYRFAIMSRFGKFIFVSFEEAG